MLNKNIPQTRSEKLYDVLYNMSNQLGQFEQADMTLSWALSPVVSKLSISTGNYWDLVPVLFAAGLWLSVYQDDIKYIPNLDAIRNNAHCIITAFKMVAEHVVVVANNNASKESIAKVHQEFFKLSSAFLMCVPFKAAEKERDWVPKANYCMFHLLQKFADSSPYITTDFTELWLPYSISQFSVSEMLWENKQERYSQTLQKGNRLHKTHSDEDLVI